MAGYDSEQHRRLRHRSNPVRPGSSRPASKSRRVFSLTARPGRPAALASRGGRSALSALRRRFGGAGRTAPGQAPFPETLERSLGREPESVIGTVPFRGIFEIRQEARSHLAAPNGDPNGHRGDGKRESIPRRAALHRGGCLAFRGPSDLGTSNVGGDARGRLGHTPASHKRWTDGSDPVSRGRSCRRSYRSGSASCRPHREGPDRGWRRGRSC